VKQLLPTLKPKTQKQRKQLKPSNKGLGKPAKALLRRLGKAKRMFKDLSSTFGQADFDLAADEREKVLEQFRELSKAVEDCLQINISVG
jgi:DNA replication protein DnaC